MHVSAILHALEDLFSQDKLSESVTTGCCSWLDPRPKKVSPLPMSDLHLEKHVWAHSKSRQFKKMETFNPFPPEARSQHFHQQSTVNMVSDMSNNYIGTVIILYSNDFHGSYCLYYQNQIATQIELEYRIITVPIL